MARVIHLDVEGGSVPRILQLHAFFNLFEDGLEGTIHSAGVNSLDFGLATLLVSSRTGL